MGFLNNLLRGLRKPKKVHVSLDADSVREHNMIRALANESAELKGELARYRVEEAKDRESKKDQEEEEEVRWKLNEEKQELEKKTYPQYFSLKHFFNRLSRNKKFREKIGFFSFDRSTKISEFGDIGFSGDGDIILLNQEGEVIMKMRNLNDIFQSVGGLGNDAQAFKLPINVDKEGRYVENIMVWETPELVPTKDGRFKYAKARKKELYKYLNELRAQISEQQDHIEELELTNTHLHRENDELKVAQRVAEDDSETSRSELGQAEQSVSAISRIFRGTERELAQIRDTNVILGDNLDKLETQLTKMRDEAEREGIKLSDDRALETIQTIRRSLVRDEPSKEVRIVEKSPEIPPK